jgi:hypothetical protein
MVFPVVTLVFDFDEFLEGVSHGYWLQVYRYEQLKLMTYEREVELYCDDKTYYHYSLCQKGKGNIPCSVYI